MESRTESDEFERINLVTLIEKDRGLVKQYDEHQTYYRTRIEDNRYKLGRLDEKLGAQND